MATDEHPVVLEDVESFPKTNAIFLLPCTVIVKVRNKGTQPILIKKVECELEVDADFQRFVPYTTPFINLPPSHLSPPIPIEFIADISLKELSNFYKIVISYRNSEKKSIRCDPRGKFFTFQPAGSGSKQVFLSHKDPEDTELARKLSSLLHKLGYTGYISEDDHRPGLKLWEEKIPTAIKSSVGLVVLWTSNAAQNQENIVRELQIAKELGIRLFLAPELDVQIPEEFPKEFEYYRFNSTISAKELKNLALSIDASYKIKA